MTATHIYKSSDFFRQDCFEADSLIGQELIAFRLHLLAHDWEPIPVGGKGHLHVGWSSGEITPERIEIETQLGTAKGNTGLRCGHTVGVDNDLRNPEHAALIDAEIERVLGWSPLKRRGSKGPMWVYRNENPTDKLTITGADDKRLFEILGQGQQFVAFGKHPDGMDYCWEGPDPFTTPLAEVPEVTPEQLRELHGVVRAKLIELGYALKAQRVVAVKPKNERSYGNAGEDIPELCRAALQVIDNDLDREGWIDMAYAMHDAGLDSSDWGDFCSKWRGSHKPGAIEKAWNSCTNPRSTTFRTILGLADEADPDWRKRYYRVKNDAYWEQEMARIGRDIAEMDAEEEETISDSDSEDIESDIEADNEPVELDEEVFEAKPAADDTFSRPLIQIQGGELPTILERAEQVLVRSKKLALYQRDGRVVRVGHFPVHKQRAGLAFVEMNADAMLTLFTRIIDWRKWDGRAKDYKTVDCPTAVANAYLSQVGFWKLPVIRSIITAPTLLSDGRILDQVGYDAGSAIYYDPQGVEYPIIERKPGKDEARSCLDALIELVSEVPFVSDADCSVFLAAFLTGLVRADLPAAPMFCFDSPTPGSGKSILTDVVAIGMTGYPARPLTQGYTDEETEKRLGAALRAGDAAITFDNCIRPIEGELLCQAITQPYLSLRILGKSETAKVTNSALYLANGNNLVVMGDMTRRALRSTIDPQCERPELRTFTTTRPDHQLLALRPAYVYAGLTALRAFIVSGQPAQTKPLGSFEAWNMVRDALIWLGEADPAETIEKIRSDDPERERNLALLEAWYEKFHESKRTLKEIIEVSEQRGEPSMGQPSKYLHGKLRDALCQICDNRPSSTLLGGWARENKDRVVGDYMLMAGKLIGGNRQWTVRRISEPKQEEQESLSTASIFRIAG